VRKLPGKFFENFSLADETSKELKLTEAYRGKRWYI